MEGVFMQEATSEAKRGALQILECIYNQLDDIVVEDDEGTLLGQLAEYNRRIKEEPENIQQILVDLSKLSKEYPYLSELINDTESASVEPTLENIQECLANILRDTTPLGYAARQNSKFLKVLSGHIPELRKYNPDYYKERNKLIEQVQLVKDSGSNEDLANWLSRVDRFINGVTEIRRLLLREVVPIRRVSRKSQNYALSQKEVQTLVAQVENDLKAIGDAVLERIPESPEYHQSSYPEEQED